MEKEREDGGISELRSALDSACRTLLRHEALSAEDVRLLADLLVLVRGLPALPSHIGVEVLVHAAPDSGPAGVSTSLRFMVTHEAAEIRYLGPAEEFLQETPEQHSGLSADGTTETNLDLREWLRLLGQIVENGAKVTIRSVTRESRLHELARELAVAILDYDTSSAHALKEAEQAWERRGVVCVDLPRELDQLEKRLVTYFEMFPDSVLLERFPLIPPESRAEWLWEQLISG